MVGWWFFFFKDTPTTEICTLSLHDALPICGAFTGGLIGWVFGPGVALAGAAVGGSLRALIGASDEIAFDDPKLDEFAASLANDTSALILVGEEATLADFVSAVEPYGGKIIETDLDEKHITALRKALKKAA